VDGPADRFDPERLPAHGTDQPYPLVPVTDDQEVATGGIVQGSGNAGIPDRREVLRLIYQDRIVLPGIPAMLPEVLIPATPPVRNISNSSIEIY
jgi:hypothetical protein